MSNRRGRKMSRPMKKKRSNVGNGNIEKEIRKSIIANKPPGVATADHHQRRRAISKTVLHWRKNNAVAASGSKSNKNTTSIKQHDEMFLFPTASEDSAEDDHHSQRGGGSRNKDSSGGTTGNKRKGRGEQRDQKQSRRKSSQLLLNEEMNAYSLTAVEKKCGRLQLRNKESTLSLCSTSSKTNNKNHGAGYSVGRSRVEASKPKNNMGRQHGRRKTSSQKENEEPTNDIKEDVLTIYVLLTI